MKDSHTAYLEYINQHRAAVLESAKNLGIYYRGLLHDLSKFERDEFVPYADYFYGGHEHNNVPKDVQDAFDHAATLHMQRNPHHWQYWLKKNNGTVTAHVMDETAVLEMVADWKAMSKTTPIRNGTLDWYRLNRDKIILHPSTRERVEELVGWKNDDHSL